MCIGIPMRVIEKGEFESLCEGRNGTAGVDMRLVGAQEPGTWVLTFLGAAREVLTDEAAANINNALSALNGALAGATDFDHLFADLTDREPELPPHLRTDNT